MKDEKIIEAMARANWNAVSTLDFDQMKQKDRARQVSSMQAAYAVAKEHIRDQVLEEVMQELTDNCEAQACDVIIAMKGAPNE